MQPCSRPVAHACPGTHGGQVNDKRLTRLVDSLFFVLAFLASFFVLGVLWRSAVVSSLPTTTKLSFLCTKQPPVAQKRNGLRNTPYRVHSSGARARYTIYEYACMCAHTTASRMHLALSLAFYICIGVLETTIWDLPDGEDIWRTKRKRRKNEKRKRPQKRPVDTK